MKIEVAKRNGTIEDYDESKIVKVVVATGLEPEQAQTLAVNVTKWIKDNSLSKVTSLQIRDQVVEGLKKVNKYSANLFVWYEETKNQLKGPSDK